jgi:hypothetical protein
LYVNDLPDCVNSTAKLFADDTKLYREIIDPAMHFVSLKRNNHILDQADKVFKSSCISCQSSGSIISR